MKYKRVLKNRKVRLFLLSLLSFVPDEIMLRIQYRIKFKRKLDLKNPKRYTEKIQWYKLNYRNPLMEICSDKYRVRQYVEQAGCGNILNELYGIYDNFNDIDLDALPKKFVLKSTLGCGGNNVIICTNKDEINEQFLKKHICSWLKYSKKSAGREWAYKGMPRIIAEKYIEPENRELGFIEYKFHCFNGRVKVVQVVADSVLGKDFALAHYTPNLEKLPYYRSDERPLTINIEKPENYSDLIEIAQRLATPFPHVRVDLYIENGKAIFGEMTFFQASGYCSFEPDEFDFILGDYFKLP
jgi:hypothetical protein